MVIQAGRDRRERRRRRRLQSLKASENELSEAGVLREVEKGSRRDQSRGAA
jgi:hypothetical protein